MTNPNEPAFVRRQVSKKPPTKDDAVYEHGITKREYFATMAMQFLAIRDQKMTQHWCRDIAENACLIADALINELNKSVT